jgi:hypothetical protein
MSFGSGQLIREITKNEIRKYVNSEQEHPFQFALLVSFLSLVDTRE